MPHHEIEGIPSVTQVIGILNKPFLLKWYATNGWDKCEAIKRESAELGSAVHDSIANYLQGKEVNQDGKIGQLFNQWKDWHGTVKFEPLLVEPEEPLISTLGFQGTPDAVAMIDGTLTICDWKTSSMIDDLHGLQLAAYSKLYEEKYGEFPEYGIIVNPNKKGRKAKVRYWDNMRELWPIFEALLKVYKWQKNL